MIQLNPKNATALFGLVLAVSTVSACANSRSIALKAESISPTQIRIQVLGAPQETVKTTVLARGTLNGAPNSVLADVAGTVEAGTPQIITLFKNGSDRLQHIVWTASVRNHTAQITFGQKPIPAEAGITLAPPVLAQGLPADGHSLGNQKQPIQPMCIEVWLGPPSPAASQCAPSE